MSARDAGFQGTQARSAESGIEFTTAGADHESPDAASEIELTGVIERRKLLVPQLDDLQGDDQPPIVVVCPL